MIEIPESDYKNLKSDSIQACCMSSGKTARTSNDNWIEFDEFFVGTKVQIDQAREKANKTKITDLVEPKNKPTEVITHRFFRPT